LCTRYMAVKLSITNIQDHSELANRLRALGHSSHGLIVDSTNYIMQELGQPLHAFDADQVVGSIHVRHATAGETIETLDGIVRTLDPTMLVIADDQKVLAIAGVMGGKSSQITESTTNIILEAAHFDPTNIRTTAHKLSLRTDAVQRYEKSLDPYMPETALRRFLLILGQYCTVKVISEIVDQFPLPPQPQFCVINPQRVKARIGNEISTDFVSHTLTQLGFLIEKKNDQEWQLTIPNYRATKDISSEADIVEEVARLYGYEKITPILPRVPLGLPIPQPWYELEKKVKTFLAFAAGLQEVSKHSFYSESTIKQFSLPHQHTVLRNSLSQDHTHLRVSLLPGLCDVVQKNSTTKLPINIFEIGKVFLPSSKNPTDLPNENVMIGMAVSDPENSVPFKKAQAIISRLLSHLHLETAIEPWTEDVPTAAQAGRAATIKVANQIIGHIFEVAGVVRSRLKLEQRVAYAEINFEQLLNIIPQKALEYEPVPKFPHKAFDVSVVVDRTVAAGTLLHELQKLDPLIYTVQLFDIYEGDKIATNTKALAYQFTLQSQERTLTDDDMHRVQNVVFDFLTAKYDGVIRGRGVLSK
ncbi:phenylalanine--tRNA ligase subunit beta, partial [Candidatus Gracilibacteria bacterium]|nr:phenylalanine--tRNA ligase subunit beta [Candidatus Gracilibacteria bacterium]